ncbi:MAG: hydrogen peroxide-inducible genes activator [Chitinophagales bacterium]|nr:hydrogen peroxide-inducible genes activator [Bacteroidota bacterium]MCB9043181.1 hydrogen peroxide-inducible genes activator [Chitinophagales bacterium]
MNLQQIEYILAVAELHSFSKAADKCCITQSTLSTMINKYEKEVSIRIFDRKTQPVSITKEGAFLIEQLKIIAKEVAVLAELAQSIKGELSGELKIGVIPTVAPFILPKFLNNFTKNFPKIKFSISEMTTETITDLLLKRELDVGILAIPLEITSLQEIVLYNEPFVLYDCTQKIAEKYASIDTLDFEKFWLLSEGHCLHTQVKNICDIDSIVNKQSINFDFKAGSIDSLVRFVKLNEGITLLPYLATLDFTAEENAKIAHFKLPEPVRTIGLITHAHFVKKQILQLLKVEIQATILPLLPTEEVQKYVVPPVELS